MLINNREYQTNHPLNFSEVSSSSQDFIVKLNYLRTLAVSGRDPVQYMQGQLTCDVSKVNKSNAQPGAICNIKGRIIALLNVIFWNNYYLLLPQDLATKVQKTLTKTAMFSQVNVKPEPELIFFGIYSKNSSLEIDGTLNLPTNDYEAFSNNNFSCIKLANNLYIIITKKAYANIILAAFGEEQIFDELSWHTLCIQANLAEIYPSTSAEFLPHRLDLHKSDFISFDKGCFVGQEIIARTHYRAKIKHGMFNYKVKTTANLLAGQKIYSATDNREIGELIDFTVIGENQYIVLISMLLEHDNEIKIADNAEIILLK